MLRHTITQYQKDEEEEEEPPFNKAILQERLDQSQKLPSPWRNPFEKKKSPSLAIRRDVPRKIPSEIFSPRPHPRKETRREEEEEGEEAGICMREK